MMSENMADLFCFYTGRKLMNFTIDENGIGHSIMSVRSTDTDRFFKGRIPFFFSALQEGPDLQDTFRIADEGSRNEIDPLLHAES